MTHTVQNFWKLNRPQALWELNDRESHCSRVKRNKMHLVLVNPVHEPIRLHRANCILNPPVIII